MRMSFTGTGSTINIKWRQWQWRSYDDESETGFYNVIACGIVVP